MNKILVKEYRILFGEKQNVFLAGDIVKLIESDETHPWLIDVLGNRKIEVVKIDDVLTEYVGIEGFRGALFPMKLFELVERKPQSMKFRCLG